MCLSNNRDRAVTFSNTILLAAEVSINGQLRHLCGYHNKVTGSKAKKPHSLWADVAARLSDSTGPDFGYEQPAKAKVKTKKPAAKAKPTAVALGNAMLIAIPAKPGTVRGDNLIPVGDFPSFMTDYAKALIPQRPRSRGSMRSRGSDSMKGVEIVSNFDNGTYDVIIADSAKKIVKAIDAVAEAKRPQVNAALYAQLDKLYPKWTFLLFCFSEETAGKAGSALVSYEPMAAFEHVLYLPGLDGHSGVIEQGNVELNHTIVLGSHRMVDNGALKTVSFTERAIEQKLPFLPKQVIGHVIPQGTMVPQGDFLFSCEDVTAGTFRALRAKPPGWSKVFGEQSSTPFYIGKD